MVKVYFETDCFAELAAIFKNEEVYLACLPALEKLAKDIRYTYVTESVTENDIDDLKIEEYEN